METKRDRRNKKKRGGKGRGGVKKLSYIQIKLADQFSPTFGETVTGESSKFTQLMPRGSSFAM